MITVDDIEAARARIAPFVRRTPTMRIASAREPLPVKADVVAKLELLQVTGSFKARGAMNRFLGTPPEEIAGGIVTASGGNHGLAVARTAFVARVPAYIFVPSNVSPAKVEKMKSWNADVRIVGDEWTQSNKAALAHAAAIGAAYFHPFADPLVVAGQGTVGLEILEDVEDFDTVVVAIGGGGLVAGLGTALKARRPGVRVIGVEPTGSPTLKACLEAGRRVALDEVTSKVPTMSCRETDQRVFETVRDTIDDIVLVSDDDMLDASKWLWSEFAIAADLAGSAAIAALRTKHAAFRNAGRICVIVCGAGLEGAVA
ncbi:threonine ammonia-lyase [Mesorhizobium sp. A623]